MDFELISKELKNISKTEIEAVQGIVLVHTHGLYGKTTDETIEEFDKVNKNLEDRGIHFMIDDTKSSIYSMIDKKYKADFLKGKATYISKALFSQEPNGKVIYVYIQTGKEINYEETEKNLIRFLVLLLREFKLTAKDVWRGFDLDGSDVSPLHLLDKDIFEKYIIEIEKFIPPKKSSLEGVNGDPHKFIEAIANGCLSAHKKYSILPSLTMAQAALESGWGKNAIGNNLFGIKAFSDWTGKKKLVWTTEYDANGNAYKTQAWFRDYDSVDESLDDHGKVLSHERYAKVREAKNYKEATQAVKDAGYATDPNYPQLLNSIIEDFNMNKYDEMINKSITKTPTEEPPIDDDSIEIVSPFKDVAAQANKTISEYIHDFYMEHKDKAKEYAARFTPWDKDRNDIKDNPSGNIETRKTPYDNLLTFKISQKAPAKLGHCEKASDRLDAVETPNEVLVEPIYPDLVTPPGGDVHIADGFSEGKVQSSSNTPLTIEEFEKRQKVFDFSKFSNVKKETSGRPINTEDPFPVDDQIKKLEEHYPKVKIDKITFDFTEDNHPNSEIGAAMAKNYAMAYDMVTEVAKRIEQRLVKIENNLSTVMRNLFRVGSRMNINCVYYGGQSVYGKYRCIRCLDDARINDGAIVTLDQCMNCTRYEPILGQVYAILDEAGSNVVQVMDDLQMSYMNLKDYKDLNAIQRYHTEPDNAKVDEHPAESPEPFTKTKWKDSEEELEAKGKEEEDNTNGFKMDWNPVLLETQNPHINEYDIEGLKVEKKVIESDNQEIDKFMFQDTREDAIEYEKLEFDIKDYVFDKFGNSDPKGDGSSGDFGMGAIEARNKIVDYALKAVELCKSGKAAYSQSKRYNHMDNAINGFHYWDCSSLVQRAYEAAGISGIGTYTANQYPHCLQSNGGMLIPLSEKDKALPGDMVWFKNPPIPTTVDELERVNYGDTSLVHHIAIYIGDNKYAHASTANADSTKDIKISELGYYNHEMCFGRVKALIELDKQASSGTAGVGHWDKEKHGITDEWWNGAKVADGNAENLIANMAKYGYKEAIKTVAKEKNIDPYLIAAISSVESGGDPTCGGPDPGIMQCSNGYSTTLVSGIEDNFRRGVDMLYAKKRHLLNNGWVENNLHVLVSAYNSGEGSITNATGHGTYNMPKLDLAKCTITELGNALHSYMSTYLPSWGPDIRKYYSTKVMRAYLYLYNKKVLE